jgi:2-keto-4-pentenoate hydratase/2-oxohepta-3-ene-1,7-dioic acid hydratase in catechol pathway
MSDSPVRPVTIVGVERNYGATPPEQLRLFLRPRGCVIGPDEPIVLPSASSNVVVQCEIGIVIGSRTRNVEPQDVPDHIGGFTCLNDVTAIDLFRMPEVGTTAKWFDTFMPTGPVVVPALPAAGAEMTTAINGEILLRGHSSELALGMNDLVSRISQLITLQPGDIVMSGGPPGLPRIEGGDTVVITIEGIGSLSNPVVDGR